MKVKVKRILKVYRLACEVYTFHAQNEKALVRVTRAFCNMDNEVLFNLYGVYQFCIY